MAEKAPVGTTMFGPKPLKTVYEDNFKVYCEYNGGVPVYTCLVHDSKEAFNTINFLELPSSIKEGKKYLVRIYEYED